MCFADAILTKICGVAILLCLLLDLHPLLFIPVLNLGVVAPGRLIKGKERIIWYLG